MKSLLAKIWKELGFSKNTQLFFMKFLQDRFLVGVTGIVFNDKNEVLLFKHTYRPHAWSLPGGYLIAREHPGEGLEREIKEESGLVVSMDEIVSTRTDRENARLDICYLGVLIGGDFSQSHEVSEYGFFPLSKLPLLRKNQLFLIEEALELKKRLK